MVYSGVSWAMDLLTHLLHYYFFVVLPSFFIIPLCLYLCSILCLYHHISFYAISDDLSHFNAWMIVISLSTPISWTLVRRSLVEKVILSERVRLHHCLREYPFHYVFSVVLVCWYLEYVQVKKIKIKINAYMYVYSVILRWGCFIELVAYESSYVNFQESFIFLCLSRYVSYVW